MKIHGIPVVYDPACNTMAKVRGIWPFHRITVGPHWYALEGEARAAVLMHEVGHCRGHHGLLRLLAVPLVILWAIGEWCGEVARVITHRQELAADLFAAEQGFGAELAETLARFPAPESPFYPSHDVRRAFLLERHRKEVIPWKA